MEVLTIIGIVVFVGLVVLLVHSLSPWLSPKKELPPPGEHVRFQYRDGRTSIGYYEQLPKGERWVDVGTPYHTKVPVSAVKLWKKQR